MMLLEQEAKQLFSALNPRISEGAGLVIQFIGSNPNQGTSTLARSLSDLAGIAMEGRNTTIRFCDLDTTG